MSNEKPNVREARVLRDFIWNPEPWGRFAGAGEKTRLSLLAKGWIRHNTNPDYPADYYEITEAGKEAAYR